MCKSFAFVLSTLFLLLSATSNGEVAAQRNPNDAMRNAEIGRMSFERMRESERRMMEMMRRGATRQELQREWNYYRAIGRGVSGFMVHSRTVTYDLRPARQMLQQLQQPMPKANGPLAPADRKAMALQRAKEKAKQRQLRLNLRKPPPSITTESVFNMPLGRYYERTRISR